MNDVILSGFLKSPDNPFVLIDLGIDATNTTVGLDYFNSLNVGAQTNYTTESNTSSSALNIARDVSNAWLEANGDPAGVYQQLNDFGIIVYAGKNGLPTTETNLVGNGVVSIYTSFPPKAPRPPEGAVVLCTNPTGLSNNSNTTELWTYDSGAIRIKASWSLAEMADAHMLFTPDGSIFFFFTRISSSTLNPVLATLPSQSVTLVEGRELELGKMYCLRSVVSTMSGNVKNATGGPAVNFTVMAFNRVTGQIVGRSTVDANGNYEMICSAVKGNQLFVVCLDDDGVAPNFEGKILDKIIV